jgi:mannosyl-oligosaccharide alpha-1,2-mannosidase
VDAISTALIMENKEVVQQIVEHIKTIDFTKTVKGGESVSLFETTIRYLAGLVSGILASCLAESNDERFLTREN